MSSRQYYFRLQVSLESGGPGLEWLNNTVFIGEVAPMSVVYACSPCDSAIAGALGGLNLPARRPMLYPLSYGGGTTWKGYRRLKVSVAVRMLAITSIDVTPST